MVVVDGRGEVNVVMVEIKRIHGRLGSILEQLPFPGNGARKLVGIFLTHTDKSASARKVPL